MTSRKLKIKTLENEYFAEKKNTKDVYKINQGYFLRIDSVEKNVCFP